jgi:hypothetical protein
MSLHGFPECLGRMARSGLAEEVLDVVEALYL